MRSDASNTTDFVQDYAAKRAAQLERAKKIREERQRSQHQQQSSQPAIQQQPYSLVQPTSSNDPKSTGVVPPILQPPARSRRIANVVEDDFKRATKAGIITPDQARQLWAMLSDQLIQVENAPPNPTASTHLDSVRSNSSASSSGLISAAGIKKRSTGFGNSISLDSLRASIAQFKKQQQQLHSDSNRVAITGNSNSNNNNNNNNNNKIKGHATRNNDQITEAYDVATRVFAPTPASAVSGTAGAAMSRPARRELRGGNNNSNSNSNNTRVTEERETVDEMESWGLRRSPTSPRPRRDKRQQQQPPSERPPWNFDVGPSHEDEREENVRVASHQHKQQRSQQQRWGVGSGRATPRSNVTAVPLDEVVVGGRAAASGATTGPVVQHQQPQAQRGSSARMVGSKKPGMAPPSHVGSSSSGGGGGGGGAIAFDDIVVGGSSTTGAGVAPPKATGPAQGSNGPLVPCGLCGRTFRASIVSRHENACAALQKKRQAFDVKGQRLDGIEGIKEVMSTSSAPVRGGKKPAASTTTTNVNSSAAGKLPKWKIQHEQFQAAMRAMRHVDAVNTAATGKGRKGNPLPPPPAPLPEAFDDRVPCPHCGRKFAQLTAERHIPKCLTTIAKPKGIRPTRR